MADWATLRAMPEKERAAAYLNGDTKLVDDLWWATHWQWQGSPGHVRLCVFHEAISLMAWEMTAPTLTLDQEMICEALQLLNSFAKTIPHTNAQKQIYWLKREAMRWAVKQGIARIRNVATLAECKKCSGTGEYFAWHWKPGDKPEKCRRCDGTGRAKLTFHEVNIADRFTFHILDSHHSPFAEHQIGRLRYHYDPSMGIDRPGEKMDREQSAQCINFLKRKFWMNQPGYVHDIYTCEPSFSGWAA